jgi:hypothetical protein
MHRLQHPTADAAGRRRQRQLIAWARADLCSTDDAARTGMARNAYDD